MNNKIAIRYVLFYFSVIFFLSFYSTILDSVFFYVEGLSGRPYGSGLFEYAIIFVIMYMYITIPLTILYNYAINNLLSQNVSVRIAFGLFIGLIVGVSIGDKGVGLSMYIGKWRWLKHLLVFSLTGISIELLRIVVVKIRMRNQKIDMRV